jgi:beta-lactam-binding protein with PASTA domain
MEHRAVPSVVGLQATTAEALLQSAGFRMSPAAPMGTQIHVRSQAPPPGVQMAVGAVVSVIFGS